MANNKSTIQPVNKHVKLSEKISDDMMSKLPEPILLHILSFLSTKEAAKTSVLSEWWQYQWTWLPDIDINQREISASDMSLFSRIILKIFLSRRVWCIRKLKLSWRSVCDIIIDSILRAAAKRNVEELDLCVYSEFYEFPTSLLCCKTLVVLKLRGEILIDNISSSSVHLPSLKVLHLRGVEYKDEDSFRNIFLGCPVLDYIFIGIFEIDHTGFHYEISSLTARHVILREDCSDPHPPSKITVSAPALKFFTIDYDAAPLVLVLNNVSSMVRVTFNICPKKLRDNYWDTIKVPCECSMQCPISRVEFHVN